jgi:hypothetical protein
LLDSPDWRIRSFAVGHLRQLSDLDRPPDYADEVIALFDTEVDQPDDNALTAGEGYGEYLTELARAALELNDVRTLRAMSILGIEFGTIFQEFVAAQGAMGLQYLDEAWTDDGKRAAVAETWALMLGQFAGLLSVQERRDLLGRLPAVFEHDPNDLAYLAAEAGLPELVPSLMVVLGDPTVHAVRRSLVANKTEQLRVALQGLTATGLHARIQEWIEVFCRGQLESGRQTICDATRRLLPGSVSNGTALDRIAQYADEAKDQGFLTPFEAALIAGNARFLITSQGLTVERETGVAGDTNLRQDSIVAWTNRLRTGTLPEKMQVVGFLNAIDVAELPADTRAAMIAELERINNDLLNNGVLVPPGVARESFGEYYMDLAITIYYFDTPEAQRALIPAVGISRGVQRRVARLGDEAFPGLVQMVEKGLSVGDVIETMALAWFWADSTGAPLSDASRRTTLMHILNGIRISDWRSGAAGALTLIGDPAFLPLATAFLDAMTDAPVGDRVVTEPVLRGSAIPDLRSRAENTPPPTLLARTRRLLDLLCLDATGDRAATCVTLGDLLSRGPQDGMALAAAAQQSDAAVTQGIFTPFEAALIAGNARFLITSQGLRVER